MGIGCWRVTVSALTHYPVWLLLLVAALSLPSGIGGWVGVYFWRLFSMMVDDLILCGGGMAGSAVLQGPLSFLFLSFGHIHQEFCTLLVYVICLYLRPR